MIVITAPTSNIGGQVVSLLLETDQDLRLVARDASRLSGKIRDRAEVVEGSHGDPEVIGRACEGADAVFWLPPNLPGIANLDESFVDFTRPASEAFAKHGVDRVVGISALGRGSSQAENAGQVTASLAMDDLLGSSRVAYRAVVNPSFMDNLLNHAGAMKEKGAFFMMMDPDLRVPTVATRDIAATAARLLTDPTWSGTGEVACLGPEDLSMTEQARIISEVLGREVVYHQIPAQAFKEKMMSFGMSDVAAQGYVDMFEAKNDGIDNSRPRTEESTTPTTFRQWCEEVLKPAVEAA